MKHSGKIKKAALASVLAVSMVVSMFNFGSSNGRNGPKMEGEGVEEEVVDNKVGSYAASKSFLPDPEYAAASIGDITKAGSNYLEQAKVTDTKEYSVGDEITFSAITCMHPDIYGRWGTREAYGKYIQCGGCYTKFNANSYDSAIHVAMASCGNFNWIGNTDDEIYTETYWIPDESPCRAVFCFTLPDGLSYKEDSVRLWHLDYGEIDKSKYQTDISGNELTVTIDNIKSEPFYNQDITLDSSYTRWPVSVLFGTEMNGSITAANTASATVSYTYKGEEKTIDLGKFSVYSSSLQLKNTDASGNAITGSKFALYKEKVTYTGNIGTAKFHKIAELTSTDGMLEFKGLGAGRYKLVQVSVPDGYKKAGSTRFNISMDGKDGSITSLAVKDDTGANLPWTSDTRTGVISAVITNNTDQIKTKEISAQVKYSYDGNIETPYTQEITSTVSVLEENAEISTSGISGKDKAGYKLGSITVNGDKVDRLPGYVHDGDVIIYHYIKDADLKKTLRATVKYYKDEKFLESSISYSKEVGYFETMLPTDGISDRASEFSGYKLSKITVDGEEVQSIPAEVPEGTVIGFYYVVDDGQTKTLTASVQHILVDWNTGAEMIQESDNFTYSKEVGTLDSSYINASDIPVKGYNGFKTAYYYIGTSKYSVSEWKKAKVLTGSAVKIYYTMDLSVSVTWSATVQYKLGDTVQDEITVQSEPANPYLFETGIMVLGTDKVSEKTYKGWKLDSITVNGQEKVSLPATLQDGDIVVYNYVPVSSSVNVRYVDENGEPVADGIVLSGTYGQPYETEQKNIEGYDFVSVNGNKEGAFGEEDITIIYQYAKKQMPLTVKYVDKDTGSEIADGYSSFVYYGETYGTVAKDIPGYEFAGDNGKTSGEYGTEPVEVIYYYTKAPVSLTVKHVFEGKPDLDRTEVVYKKPGESYKTEPLDMPGYVCTTVSGMAEGVVSEDMVVTYYYEAKESRVTVQYVDEEGTPIDSPVTLRGKYGESYETVQREINGYTFVSSTGNTSGTFGLSDIEVIYSYKESLASLVIKYVDEDGNEIAEQDEDAYCFYSNYSVSPKEITGYNYKKVADTSAPAKGMITANETTVVFIYQPKDVAITVKHVDESGKEIVAKETITRKYKESYTTSPKEITGYVLTETPENASGQVLAEDFTVTYVYALDDSNTKTLSATVRYSLNGKLQDEDEETVTKTVQVLSEETTLSTDSIHEKSYEGWVLDYITINDEERMDTLPKTVEDKDVVIFVYKKAPASVTVLYQNEEGREIKAAKTLTGKYGDSYNIDTDEIEGYDLISESGNTAGEMKGNITVVYTYRLKDMSVTVKYVDEDGKEIADSKEISGKYGQAYTDSAIDISGYTLTSDRNISGTFGDGKNEIVYTYKKEVLSVTVRYVDEEGNEIAGEYKENKEFGESYETSAKDITGYVLKETPENATGVMGDEGITITYVYELKKVIITVKHTNNEGNKIAEEETFIKKYKEEYVSSAKEITGYKLSEIPENASGQTPADNFVVEYVYIIDESQKRTLSASVQYSLGGNIQGADTVTLQKTVQILSKDNIISTDKVSAKKYNGWELDYITVDGEKVDKIPASVSDGSTIVYHYKKAGTPSVKKVRITVKHVDEDGREIADTETTEAVSGSSYETHAGTFEGYDFVSDSGNTAGIADSDIIVTYVYRLQDAMVTVKYVDEDGKEIAASNIISGKYGDKYKTEAMDISGYELVSGSRNMEGVMKASVTVTYTYRLQTASVTVKYVDDKTGKEIAGREVLKGHMFDKYETTTKEIDGYTLIKTPANAKGVITEKNTIVTYRYSADEGITKEEESLVIVQYVDEDGNKITGSVIMSGKVGDTYETGAKEIDGYELLASADNASGVMDKFTTIVTYVYKPVSKDEPGSEKPAEGGVITVADCPADLLSLQVYNYNPFAIEFNRKTYQTGALIAVIRVNPDGTASLSGVPFGTYRIKEYRTTTGFSANRNYYTVKVEDSNGSGDDNINPAPAQTGSIRLTGANNISLQGMEFKLKNIGESSVVYDGKIINVGDELGRFTVDGVSLVIDSIPYGIYELIQTGCTKGYHPDPSVYTINIVNESPIEITIQVSNHEHEWDEGYVTTAPTCTETGVYTYTCAVCDGQMTEVIDKLGHEYYTKEPTCQEAGYRECTRCGDRLYIPKVEHNWDDGILTTSGTSCETNAVRVHTCRYCGEKKTVVLPNVSSHSYETSIEKATPGQDGHIVKTCTKCGNREEDSVIAGLSHMALAYKQTSYTGSALKPAVTVYDTNGNKISSSYYIVNYCNNIKVGIASVKVTFKGNYTGVMSDTFEIAPHGTSILSVTPLSRGFTVKWEMQDRGITGYELEYATKEDFSDAQILKTTKYTTLAKSMTGLKADTEYYLRIRTYKGSAYSGWSAVKTVVTKK